LRKSKIKEADEAVMRNLHEKVGEEAMIDGGRSQGRGEMLQAGGLEPPRHDGVSSIAAVVQQSSGGGGIALRHLATRVALRTSLRRQFSRSERTSCTAKNRRHQNHNSNEKK